jgi:hypothetical protein
MIIRLHNLFIFFAFMFFYAPRVSFFQLPGSTSDIRLDILLFFAVIVITFFILMKHLYLLKFDILKSNLIIVFLFLGTLFIGRNGPVIYALFQLIWYGSIIFFFLYAKKLVRLGAYNKLQNYLRVFVNINMFSHLLFWTLSIFNIYLPTGQISPIYGVFNMPYGFALLVGIYGLIAFSNNLQVSSFEKIIIIISILLGDSRIALGGFFIGIFIILPASKRLLLALIVGLGLAVLFSYVSITDFRAVNIIFYSIGDIISDPSLNVRLGNYYNYFDWVTINNFILGYGPLSYMEYSIQYDKPGPLDVFYFRIFSDFGLLTSTILVIFFVYLCIKNLKFFFRNNNIILAIFTFLFLYSFFNEGLLVIKLGHLIALMTGLVFWNIKLKKLVTINSEVFKKW